VLDFAKVTHSISCHNFWPTSYDLPFIVDSLLPEVHHRFSHIEGKRCAFHSTIPKSSMTMMPTIIKPKCVFNLIAYSYLCNIDFFEDKNKVSPEEKTHYFLFELFLNIIWCIALHCLLKWWMVQVYITIKCTFLFESCEIYCNKNKIQTFDSKTFASIKRYM